MSTMRESLDRAMRTSSDHEMWKQLGADGIAIADQDSMSRAIHDVYCGIEADHEHPNQKDQDQARAMIAALQGRSAVSTIP